MWLTLISCDSVRPGGLSLAPAVSVSYCACGSGECAGYSHPPVRTAKRYAMSCVWGRGKWVGGKNIIIPDTDWGARRSLTCKRPTQQTAADESHSRETTFSRSLQKILSCFLLEWLPFMLLFCYDTHFTIRKLKCSETALFVAVCLWFWKLLPVWHKTHQGPSYYGGHGWARRRFYRACKL